MLNVRALKAEMVKHGYTQAKLASELGMTVRTFSNRLKTGDFRAIEIETMINLLHLKEPISIFFANKVT